MRSCILVIGSGEEKEEKERERMEKEEDRYNEIAFRSLKGMPRSVGSPTLQIVTAKLQLYYDKKDVLQILL